jgi:hypothetical protein
MPSSGLDVKSVAMDEIRFQKNSAMVKYQMSEIRGISHGLGFTEPRVSHESQHDLALTSVVSQGYLNVSACTL